MPEITITQTDLQRLLDEAAERGAKRALERVGLHDDDAGADIRDLRTLIDGWRSAKRAAIAELIKWSTIGVLSFIAAGVYLKYK